MCRFPAVHCLLDFSASSAFMQHFYRLYAETTQSLLVFTTMSTGQKRTFRSARFEILASFGSIFACETLNCKHFELNSV